MVGGHELLPKCCPQGPKYRRTCAKIGGLIKYMVVPWAFTQHSAGLKAIFWKCCGWLQHPFAPPKKSWYLRWGNQHFFLMKGAIMVETTFCQSLKRFIFSLAGGAFASREDGGEAKVFLHGGLIRWTDFTEFPKGLLCCPVVPHYTQPTKKGCPVFPMATGHLRLCCGHGPAGHDCPKM